jgi:hypothetical protein
MQFLLLCCANEQRWNALPEARRGQIMKQYGEWIRDLDRSGQHLASAQLQPVASARTIRGDHGKTLVTDGPFAETKEQLAGFYLIEARDLNEAIGLAAKIPPARVGSVEVRPIRPIREQPRSGAPPRA